MDLVQLQTLLAVLDRGSFTAAARALGIGQSTVSFHVKALESDTGSRLLDRRGGKVRVTPAGRLLQRYARRIVSLREEALAQLRKEEAGGDGEVVVAASTIPGDYLLPPVLAAFRRQHPGVSVTVNISDSDKAIAALLAQTCDVAVIGVRPSDRRIHATRVCDDEVILVGPSPNSFTPSGKTSVEELATVPLVVREGGSGTGAAVSRLLAKGSSPRAQVRVGSTESARRCVLAGVGLTFISRRAVEDDLAAKRLTEVVLAGSPIRRSFYVARLRTTTPSGATRALVEELIRIYR
jgi:DNA-binding transcriptional LysR family regulator